MKFFQMLQNGYNWKTLCSDTSQAQKDKYNIFLHVEAKEVDFIVKEKHNSLIALLLSLLNFSCKYTCTRRLVVSLSDIVF
jgi:hypothetical protein